MEKKLTTESTILFNVIQNELGVNIMSKNRSRNIVDGRLICARILRDRGYSLTSIGKSMSRDHSTIMYYLDTIHDLLSVDVEINKKHMACLKSFNDLIPKEDYEDISEMSVTKLLAEIRVLREQLNSTILSNQAALEYISSMKKKQDDANKILDAIRTRFNTDDIDSVALELRRIINNI